MGSRIPGSSIALLVLACRPTAAHNVAPASATAVEPAPAAAATDVPAAAPPGEVAEILAAIDAERVRKDVEVLAKFGTRHTLSDTTSKTRGIGAAREWIHAEMKSYGGRLAVDFDRHVAKADGKRIPREVEVVNVVATLPGTLAAASGRHYYVLGHYDSRASDPMDAHSDAPGANDDASGVAVVMEVARVLASRELDATVVLVATAAEEQGLIGAGKHAEAAKARGLDIRGVLNHDIVGDPTTPHGERVGDRVRVFSEGITPTATAEQVTQMHMLSSVLDSPSRQLARFYAFVGAWQRTAVQPALIFRHDRFLRGGDHTAFNRVGYPGVRLVEFGEEYDRQHQNVRTEDGRAYGDTADFVDHTYVADVARLTAAVLVHLANAPSSPGEVKVDARELDESTTVRWQPSPEPDVAGYEVVWRETTSPCWQHSKAVGQASEATLPLSKDDFFFGVRAVDTEGYRSPVAFAGVLR
jgi:Zn-dependent M28 family amino/carboxypeptidase